MTHLLEASRLTAGYGDVTVLHEIHLQIEEGELVAILGANGAGKSTTLRVLSGMLRPQAGSVLFRGVDIRGKRPDQLVPRGLVHVPEGREVFAKLTVEENLQLGAYRRRDRSAVDADLEAVYERFDVLKQRRFQNAGSLSGGEQQQLAIGRALLSRPSLLLLDEPSLGLAPVLVDRVFDLVRGLQKDGLTILLVEQNTRHALRVADRAYVLETGRVVLEGTPEEIRAGGGLTSAYLGVAQATEPNEADSTG